MGGRGWGVAALALLPVLYVLSSGPTQTVAFRRHVTHHIDSGRVQARAVTDMGAWWPIVYAPLIWAEDQSWGGPLVWYWKLFPIR